jgi:hypothetical protein
VPPALVLGLIVALEPPVLTTPKAALEAARAAPALRKAEIELLAGDPRRALETLEHFDPSEDTAQVRARKLRLELDAAMSAGDVRLADTKISALEALPGWKGHARRQRARRAWQSLREDALRFGTLLFAFASSIILLGAARELLRIKKTTVVFALVVLLVLVLSRSAPPPYPNALGLLAVAMLALVHGTEGAMVRVRPSPKGRLFLITTLILGVVGATLGVLSRIDRETLGALFG